VTYGVGTQSSIRRTLAGDGTAIVTVQGEIDFDNADQLARGVREAVLDGSPSMVQVDLRDASLLDSTGLGALIEGFRAASDFGVRFVVTNPTPTLRRVLSVTGLTEFFGLTAAEDNACTSASGA
jgi:anti-sigma B factor antagonist